MEWHECLFYLEDENNIVLRRETRELRFANEANNVLRSAGVISSGENEAMRVAIELNEVKMVLNDMMKRKSDRDDCSLSEWQRRAKKRRFEINQYDPVHLLIPKASEREDDARKLLPSLKSLLRDKKAIFRSAVQADVAASVLEASEDMLVIMGTGSGKSLCVLLPAFIEEEKRCSIIITPLAALVSEWMKKCHNLKLHAATWNERHREGVQIYIFAAEHVDTEQYRIFVRSLSSEGFLKRIVYDEAHGAISWEDFRPSMFKARLMLSSAARPIQRILLSATVAPLERKNLLIAYGMRSAYMFCSSTVRNNIRFNVAIARGSPLANGVQALAKKLSQSLASELLLKHPYDGVYRVIIFVMRVRDIESVAREIQDYVQTDMSGILLVYHGKLSMEERSVALQLWDSEHGKTLRVMICTSAFGAGVDTDGVRLVYHFGGCGSQVQYAQECGRSGRDGKESKCIMLWNEHFAKHQDAIRARSVSNADLIWEKEFEERKQAWWNDVKDWVRSVSRCRRRALYEYLDGSEVAPCFYESNCCECDTCAAIQNEMHDGNFEKREAEIEFLTPEKSNDMRIESKDEREELAGGDSKSSIRKAVPGSRYRTDAIGTTTAFNCEENLDERQKTVVQIAQFQKICRMIEGLCTVCLVIHGTETQAMEGSLCHSCRRDRSRCYRCLSQEHRYQDCRLPRFVKNHCNKCGLNKIDGKNVHNENEFGKTCPRPYINNIFWLLWSQGAIREEMINEVSTTSQSSAITKLIHEDGPYAAQTVETVLSWLHNKTGVPMHVRILRWWGIKKDMV